MHNKSNSVLTISLYIFIVVSNSIFSLGKPFLIKQMRDEDVLFLFS